MVLTHEPSSSTASSASVSPLSSPSLSSRSRPSRESFASLTSTSSQSSSNSNSSSRSRTSKKSKQGSSHKTRPIHSSTVPRPFAQVLAMSTEKKPSNFTLKVEGKTDEEATVTWESTSETIKWYHDVLQHHRVTVLLFYRGIWCSYCRAQLLEAELYFKELTKMDVGLYAISAQSPETSQRTKALWKLSYDVVSDEPHHLPKYFRAHDIGYISVSKRKDYPMGMIQPAVFAIDRSGKIIFQWAITPSLVNLNGALHRPPFEHVYRDICSYLQVQPVDVEGKNGDGGNKGCFSFGKKKKRVPSNPSDKEGVKGEDASTKEEQPAPPPALDDEVLLSSSSPVAAERKTPATPVRRRTSISTLV